ncbi:MAG: hypothetical protein GY842_28860 [bacterium]|nr:hypothetical protein [bacterium]
MINVRCIPATLMLIAAAGCAARQPTKLNYHVLQLSDAPTDAVFDATALALEEHFTISRRDFAAGVLQTAPVETVVDQPSGRLRDAVAAPRRERRLADVRVQDKDGMTQVSIRVIVQEYDTRAHRMFPLEHALHDLPTDTPAERDAATTKEQNSIWRTKGRDRQLEEVIRRAVLEQVPGATVR